jgi:biopolymer transport protein ExbB
VNVWSVLTQGDAVSHLVAIVLLAMSIGSWVLILWKVWLLTRSRRDVSQGIALFWQAADLTQARERIQATDRHGIVQPLLAALQAPLSGTLAASSAQAQQLTRSLRQALHLSLNKLNYGQVLLATIGSTAPFVGLLGTVWGIYHALTGISASGQISIDRVAGPVGEALIMTAAGLAVAIPAVLAYNIFGRFIAQAEAELEGFALDLRDWLAPSSAAAPDASQES